MVSYDFYESVYLGSSIPQRAFSGVMAKAEHILARFRRVYQVAEAGEAEEKLALCAMAETLYDYGKRRGIKSTSVGSVSVQYDDRGSGLTGALLASAGIYLDIYRGVAE